MQWWTCDADTSLAIHPGAAPVHKSLKLRFSSVLHPSSVISGAKTDSFSDPQTVGNTRHTHTEVSEERFDLNPRNQTRQHQRHLINSRAFLPLGPLAQPNPDCCG